MLTSIPPHITDLRQFAVWTVALVLVAFGFRYAKEMVGMVLEKLYEFFIQKNAMGL